MIFNIIKMDSFQIINTTTSVVIPYHMTDEDVIKLFQSNIPDFNSSSRYVACQPQTGDCVIYENGKIDRVADSG